MMKTPVLIFIGMLAVGCQPPPIIYPAPASSDSTGATESKFDVFYTPEGGREIFFRFVGVHDPLFKQLDGRPRSGDKGVPLTPLDFPMFKIQIPASVWQLHHKDPPCQAILPVGSVYAEVGDSVDGYDFYIEGRIEPCMERAGDYVIAGSAPSEAMRTEDTLGSDLYFDLPEEIDDQVKPFVDHWLSGLSEEERERWEVDLADVKSGSAEMTWKGRLNLVETDEEAVAVFTLAAYVWPSNSTACASFTHEYLYTRTALQSGGQWKSLPEIGPEVAWGFDTVITDDQRIEMLIFNGAVDEGVDGVNVFRRKGDSFEHHGWTTHGECIGCYLAWKPEHPLRLQCQDDEEQDYE